MAELGVSGVMPGGEMVGREGFQPQGESDGVGEPEAQDDAEDDDDEERVGTRGNIMTMMNEVR